jgi:hypothetical protein
VSCPEGFHQVSRSYSKGLRNKVSDSDFCLDVATGIPPCLDPCIAPCPLCVVTLNVHIFDLDCLAHPPTGAFLNALNDNLCRRQVLAVVFWGDLETSNISKDSSQVPSPAIDYPSSSSGSLVQSPDNNRLRKAGRRTCLARRQQAGVLGDFHSF